MEELGCTAAYNMDGGKSSVMTYNDDYVNQPADGGREISDSIVIKEID
jgi:exopolysaccharide biosynthesis protein